MSRASSRGSVAAAAVFILLAAAALLLGLPAGGNDRAGREEALLESRRAMLEGARFHKPLPLPSSPERGAFCSTCHPFPPHPGEGVAELLLNQHAVTFECLVCHWAASEGSPPDFEWAGAPSGPSGEGGGGRKLFLGLAAGAGEDPEAMRSRVTAGQACFDRGPGCRDCHRAGGLSRYARPGMEARDAEALEKLPDYLTLSRGARGYFPQQR